MKSEILNKTLQTYLNFEYQGRRIPLPYVLRFKPWDFRSTCGKGTPSEIISELNHAASEKNQVLGLLSTDQVVKFMKAEGIGVDCSGLAYNLLSPLVKEQTGHNMSFYITRYPGLIGALDKMFYGFKRIRRISADILTNDLNTVPIDVVGDALPGDLLRLSTPTTKHKHVAVIVEVTSDKLVYAHSSRYTEEAGPHLSEIQINYPEKGLDDQTWLEKTNRGDSYRDLAFKMHEGDGIRRLKCLNWQK